MTSSAPAEEIVDCIDKISPRLSAELKESGAKEVKEQVDEWGNLHGFAEDTAVETASRQSIFNLFLKTSLYEYYHRKGAVDKLFPNVRGKLQEAHEQTGNGGFQDCVLDDIVWTVTEDELRDIIKLRAQLFGIESVPEVVGKVFAAVTPQQSRHKLGQFRTPGDLAQAMASWTVADGDERVFDAGFGAGALSYAVAKEKQQGRLGTPSQEIYGIERCPLAHTMGNVALTIAANTHIDTLMCEDFLGTEPDEGRHQPPSCLSARPQVVPDTRIRKVPANMDAIVSNPPYTRHHEISDSYKKRVNKQAEYEVGESISTLSPMYAYFYYHAATLLKTGGRLSFITPSEFLEARYGITLKKFLLDEFDIRGMVLFNQSSAPEFEDALTTSVVSFLKKDSERNKTDARFVRVDGQPTPDEIIDSVNGDETGQTSWGFINTVAQAELCSETNWTSCFDASEGVSADGLVPLSKLATITRGIVTGNNEFFCLSEQERVDWGIDTQYLTPIIRSASNAPGYNFTWGDWQSALEDGRQVWLLYDVTDIEIRNPSQVLSGKAGMNKSLSSYTDSKPQKPPEVLQYIKQGKSDGVHNGYITQNREPWYKVGRRDAPPAFATYMSRDNPRFILNNTKCRTLSNLHGLYPTVDLTTHQLNALLAYLNSKSGNKHINQFDRTYASGMDKIEPNDLECVPVIDPRTLDQEIVGRLSELFTELCGRARNGQKSIEDTIRKIDEVLQKCRIQDF